MSLALKFGDSKDKNSVSGVVYFDAVTDFLRGYGGKVTEHPIEAGASITDHYVSSNQKYRIKGVISSVDFTTLPKDIKVGGEDIFNKLEEITAVSISGGGFLDSLIPDVVSQFLGPSIPQVQMSEQDGVVWQPWIEDLFREMLHGLYYNDDRQRYENRMTLSELYSVDSGEPVLIEDDLVVTQFAVTESPDTGDAMMVELSAEKVRYVTLEKADAPSPPPKTKAARQTEPKKNAGAVSSTSAPPPVAEREYSTELFNKGVR